MMDKNFMDKVIFFMVATIFLMSIFVTSVLVRNVHDISFNMGVITEKIGILEEQNQIISKT